MHSFGGIPEGNVDLVNRFLHVGSHFERRCTGSDKRRGYAKRQIFTHRIQRRRNLAERAFDLVHPKRIDFLEPVACALRLVFGRGDFPFELPDDLGGIVAVLAGRLQLTQAFGQQRRLFLGVADCLGENGFGAGPFFGAEAVFKICLQQLVFGARFTQAFVNGLHLGSDLFAVYGKPQLIGFSAGHTVTSRTVRAPAHRPFS